MDGYYNNPPRSPGLSPQQPGAFDPSQPPRQPPAAEVLNLTLTPEEQRVLQDCQKQATTRGAIAGVLGFGGCHYLMKTGSLPKNKVVLAMSGIGGFMLGMMSYRSACMEKLMALPNSTLKERILKAQGRQPELRVEVQPQESHYGSFFDSASTESSSFGPAINNAIDIEPYQSPDYNPVLNDPINNDAAFALNPPLPSAGSSFVTYDELRRKNRIDYENNAIPNRAPQQPPPSSSQSFQPTIDQRFDPSPPPPRRTDDFY